MKRCESELFEEFGKIRSQIFHQVDDKIERKLTRRIGRELYIPVWDKVGSQFRGVINQGNPPFTYICCYRSLKD